MQVKAEKQTRFGDELRLIPAWAWILAGVGFACMQFVSNVILPRDPNPPPLWGCIVVGLVTGLVVVCYMLLVGYVNGDARRRGMNRVLWTFVAILVPSGLGFILYFILRQPLPASCRQCGSTVQPGFGYCPRCGTNLTHFCQRCRHSVQADDIYCSSCGNPLKTTDPSLPAGRSGSV